MSEKLDLLDDAVVKAVTRAVGLYLRTSGPDSTLRQRNEPYEIAMTALIIAKSTIENSKGQKYGKDL